MASSTVYSVTGMTCDNCRRHVTEAAEALAGVERAEVELNAGTLTVIGTVDEQALRAAIDEAGYELV